MFHIITEWGMRNGFTTRFIIINNENKSGTLNSTQLNQAVLKTLSTLLISTHLTWLELQESESF